MKKLAFLMHKGFEGRFRVKEFIPFFEQNGVSVELLRVPDGPVERIRTFRRLGDFDMIIIQRKLLSAADLFFVRRSARRVIFDFDDAIMYRSSRHKDQNSRHRMRRFANMMRSVDAVTAGNSYLAEQAARFVDRDRIFIVPTIVDITEYDVKDYSRASDDFVAGWIGSSSTLHYLEAVSESIKCAARRITNFRLMIVCDRFIDIEGVTVIKKQWRPEDVSRDLAEMDVGLMPMPGDPWTQGKCGLKVVQYLAAGVPAIASPVGVNRDLVVPGKTGLWAEGPQQWESRMVELATDRDLRMRMGIFGRGLVEERFSLQSTAPRYLEIMRTVEKMHERRS